jgi:hypothetical protein
MHALSNADFLSLWERGRQLHPLDRGLLALHTAFSETRGESVADWPLGRRNRALVELRSSCFGSTLRCWTACPQCGEKIELNLAADVIVPHEEEDQQPHQTVTVNGETFRLPTSRDLARIAREMAHEPDPGAAAVHLLRACRVAEEPAAEKSWSEEELERIGESMAYADPLAEILLRFECPACLSKCSEALDPPTFLWAEVDALVRRLLLEVHTLASAYGWSEREILSLSDARRRLYLEMVQA